MEGVDACRRDGLLLLFLVLLLFLIQGFPRFARERLQSSEDYLRAEITDVAAFLRQSLYKSLRPGGQKEMFPSHISPVEEIFVPSIWVKGDD